MRFFPLIIIACIALNPGCSKTIVVQSEFPEPLIDELPLRVGLHYGESILDFQYSETLPQDGTWSFTLGETNAKLFDRIFGALFVHTQPVDGTGGPGQDYVDLDAVIEPTIETLEFSLPRQSRSDQYSVWIRYNVNVYLPDGNLITNWPVSAYGQSDSSLMGGNKGMEQATLNAMRDAAATILTGFANEPIIKEALFQDENEEEARPDSPE